MYLNSRHFWSNEFSAPNLVLQSLTGLSRSGILKARNTLKQMGYIDFKANGTKSTVYILHSLIANSTQVGVQDSVQASTQVGVQVGTQIGVQAGGLYSTPIEILNNNKTKDIKTKDKKDSADKEQIEAVVLFLNQTAGTNYRASAEATKKHIRARLAEGYTVDDFKTVIQKKCAEWLGTDYAKYLRPETLFGSKFEGYLNANISAKDSDGKDSSFDTDEFFKAALEKGLRRLEEHGE
ncbi:MAG: hypothetical protein HFE77_03215 [Clostridiales bacterium]|nr:hypothetical protein [Clostridiales bacterium]